MSGRHPPSSMSGRYVDAAMFGPSPGSRGVHAVRVSTEGRWVYACRRPATVELP
jgi:hypothetical protein